MLLTAEQILAAGDARTVEVDVPEWGPDAKVLVGTIGALERARLQDWLDTVGTPIAKAEDENEVISCDSPPEPEDNPAAHLELAKGLLERLASVKADGLDAIRQEAKDFLSGKLKPPERTYSRVEDMEHSIRWCVACILDPFSKQPAFTREQVEALGAKDPGPLHRICAAAMELNLATRKAADDAEKNSGRTPGGSSGGD